MSMAFVMIDWKHCFMCSVIVAWRNWYPRGHSDALGGCTLVDSILLFLARSWSMCSCHIPRTQNLVADRVVVDRVVALCRGSSIVSMMFDSVPVALVELVRKEAAAG
ncbi:hypothetical protein V6N13_065460 [Hibiscus sabdariffa]